METEPNDPAFAVASGNYQGLSKLEYIAAMAMQGLRAANLKDSYRSSVSIWSSASIAKQAISDAKALITELNKQQNEPL